jgi:hypothetical protein
MPTSALLGMILVALPLLAWTTGFLHAFKERRLPSWYDKLATGSILGSLAIAL